MAFSQWSTTAADNDDAATGINWAEGQLPSTINNSARQMMADLATALGSAAYPSFSGITFPATQAASVGANVLDDYEEGTFTPAFSAAGATFSYAVQTGRYTKIGRHVFFEVRLKLNSTGNTLASAALSITGLPFTNGSTSAAYPVGWFASTTSYVGVYARLEASGTSVTIIGITAAATTIFGGLNADAALHATNESEMRFVGEYTV